MVRNGRGVAETAAGSCTSLVRASARCLVCVLLFVAFPVGQRTATAQSPSPSIIYLYDDLNRLVGVVDQQGNAATYTYDAVGNILKIERFDTVSLPGKVAITLVSPGKGKVGAEVQIFGKGFSADPNQNSVSFNGGPATVKAAAPNRIVTSVPPGAISGPITVATALGSAASPTPFLVLTPGVITVSPTSGALLVRTALQFQAFEAGNPTTNIIWAVNGIPGGGAFLGTISADGLYTAPATAPSPATVTLTATHKDDPTLRGSATVATIGFLPGFPSVVSSGVSVNIAELLRVDKNVTASVSVFAAALISPTAVAAPLSVSVASSSAFLAAASVTVTRAPVITSVSPSNGSRGATNLVLTLTGAGFSGATNLLFLLNNVEDQSVTVTNLAVNADDTQATAEISISVGAALGVRVMQLRTPAGTSTPVGTGGNLFSVE